MLRPTLARMIYLLFGLIIGAVALFFGARYVPINLGRAPAPTPLPTPAQFSGAVLDHVLSVGSQATHNGVTVRLNSLELYSDGLSLTYAVIGDRVGATARVLDAETFVVSDDRGTSYTMSPFLGSSVPTAGYTPGYVSFSPAVPKDAKTITVVVPHVIVIGARGDGQTRVVDGPWQFQVAVPQR